MWSIFDRRRKYAGIGGKRPKYTKNAEKCDRAEMCGKIRDNADRIIPPTPLFGGPFVRVSGRVCYEAHTSQGFFGFSNLGEDPQVPPTPFVFRSRLRNVIRKVIAARNCSMLPPYPIRLKHKPPPQWRLGSSLAWWTSGGMVNSPWRDEILFPMDDNCRTTALLSAQNGGLGF